MIQKINEKSNLQNLEEILRLEIKKQSVKSKRSQKKQFS